MPPFHYIGNYKCILRLKNLSGSLRSQSCTSIMLKITSASFTPSSLPRALVRQRAKAIAQDVFLLKVLRRGCLLAPTLTKCFSSQTLISTYFLFSLASGPFLEMRYSFPSKNNRLKGFTSEETHRMVQ